MIKGIHFGIKTVACGAIILFSCGSNSTSNDIREDRDSVKITEAKKCVPKDMEKEFDNYHVKYLDRDSFFTIELRINQVTSILSYEFTCEAPRSIIPRFNSFFNDYLCLERGCSNECIEYSVYRLTESKIVEVGTFFNSLGIDLSKGVCLYIDDENTNTLIAKNLITNKSVKKVIGVERINLIEKVEFNTNEVRIKFSDNSEETLKIN